MAMIALFCTCSDFDDTVSSRLLLIKRLYSDCKKCRFYDLLRTYKYFCRPRESKFLCEAPSKLFSFILDPIVRDDDDDSYFEEEVRRSRASYPTCIT